MRSNRPISLLVAAIAGAAALSAYAGELMRALPERARHDAEAVVRFAAAQETCPVQSELEGSRAFVMQLVANVVAQHPAYPHMNESERKQLLVNLIKEMQHEAGSGFVFDCSAEGPAARESLVATLEQHGIVPATAGR